MWFQEYDVLLYSRSLDADRCPSNASVCLHVGNVCTGSESHEHLSSSSCRGLKAGYRRMCASFCREWSGEMDIAEEDERFRCRGARRQVGGLTISDHDLGQ